MSDVTLMHVSLSRPRTVPSGVLYLAAVLERDGYRVEVRDFHADSYLDLRPEAILASLEGSAPVVGMSCMSDSLPFVLRGIERFKDLHRRTTVILGGPGPSGAAPEIMRCFPAVDVIVAGEGEVTVCELLDCLTAGGGNDLDRVKGIYYRQGDEIRRTGERERITDLDELPFPRYDLVPMESYPLVNVVCSRGCPYRCTFCDVAPMWRRRNYRRSVESIVDELRFLKVRYGKAEFEFTDETFVLHPSVIVEFCGELAAKRVDVAWSCTGRVNLVDAPLLDEMAAHGCRGIFYGIESGSDRVLERIRKDFTVREAIDVVHESLKRVHVVASFVWGYPFESVDDLLRTMIIMAYFSRLGVDTRLNRLIPFARTELYAEYGDALVPRDGTHAFSPTVPFQAAGYDAEIVDLVRRHPRVFPEFYSFATDDYAEKSALVEGVGDFMHHVEWPSAPTIARREVRTVAGGAVSAAVVRGSAPCASRREAPAAVEQRR